MASLLYTDGGVRSAITFDATTLESHLDEIQVSSHPAEKSANITDHVIDAPRRLSIEVVVSQTPIRAGWRMVGTERGVYLETDPRITSTSDAPRRDVQIREGYTAAWKFPGTPRTHVAPTVTGGFRPIRRQMFYVKVVQFQNETDRLRDTFEALRDLQKRRVLLEVLTHLETYPDMLLAAISAPVETTQAVTFTLDFEPFHRSEAFRFAAVAPVAKPKKASTPAADEVVAAGATPGYSLEENAPEQINTILRGLLRSGAP